MSRGDQTRRSGRWARGAAPAALALAAALLFGCLGNAGQARALEHQACALAKAECYRAPTALDLPALPAQTPVLGAPTAPTLFAPHQESSDVRPSRVADTPAPRAPPAA